MATINGTIEYVAADLTEYENIRAAIVADPDINLVDETRSALTIKAYFDTRKA